MEMKSCNLRLDFVKSGLVGVLMSSRYFRSGMKAMWQECFRDARRLASLGYDVIRAKIEASASIDGVPENDVEAQLLPAKTYFEFHMVFRNGQDQTPTDEECEKAKQVAKRLEKEWKVCIPLSMNAFGTQRFLNMRTYGIGREKALPQLENLGKELQNIGFKSKTKFENKEREFLIVSVFFFFLKFHVLFVNLEFMIRKLQLIVDG